MLRVALALSVVAVVFTSSIHGGGVVFQPAAAPPVTSVVIPTVVPGLERPVQVLVDEWGVPHIYAERQYDAFAAQGFTAARDRLWQIDLWRKRGLGEMAKDFGPAYVESDRMARAVLFRGDLYREWLAYASDAKRIAEAFVAGINAYVDLTEREPELLSEEFRLLGYRPARWKADDIVRIRHHGLTLNLTSEITRAEAYCKDGPDAPRVDWMRRALVPDIVPDAAGGPGPVHAPFREAPAGVRARDRSSTVSPRSSCAPVRTKRRRGRDPTTGSSRPDGPPPAAPVLASDPHRTHSAPSLRYITHLVAPGLDVIGAGEPFLPGISIGHNEAIAFGLTRFYIDQEDLYVYETNPARPEEYRYKGRWEPMETITERIEVRGEAPRTVTVAFTRHGPVLVDRTPRRTGRSRCARRGSTSGMAPYFGSIEYMRARNWDQFAAAMNRWGAPGENQVYADTAGNIGWIPAGLTIVRPNWDGLTPVPGDGRYEWDGYRDMDELPRAFNPASGLRGDRQREQHPARSSGVRQGHRLRVE